MCSAAVINVPSDYSTIQRGINASSDGDTVLISVADNYSSIYYEKIDFLNKNITVSGEYINSNESVDIIKTVIYHNGPHPTVTFGDIGQNNDALLIGVSIYSENTGIEINNSDATIERCLLYNPLHGSGILCYSSSPNIINCTITGFDNAIYSEGDSNPNVNSSILWSEEIGLIGSGSVQYSCIKDGLNNSASNVASNIYFDPLFDIPRGHWLSIEPLGLDWRQREYPWIGYPMGAVDGKDNNPWNAVNVSLLIWQVNNNGDSVRVGNGEAMDTGDPDGDGVMGEDWFNGYDDDGDGLIDEDYFIADGIDNDGDGAVDENIDGDGAVDENIDGDADLAYDGIDNDHNGIIDDELDIYSGSFLFEWGRNIDNKILVKIGRKDSLINGVPNPWYIQDNSFSNWHVMGDYIYNEELESPIFDTYIYDFGEDGLPGDPFIDVMGDGKLQIGECLGFGNSFVPYSICDRGIDGIPNTGDVGEQDGKWQPGDGWLDINGDGVVNENCVFGDVCDAYAYQIVQADENDYNDVWPLPNNVWDEGEEILDCGHDGLCPGAIGYISPDLGEGDGMLIAWDIGENDQVFDMGDGIYGFEGETFIDSNGNGVWNNGEDFEDSNGDLQYTPPDYIKNWSIMPGISGMGLESIYDPRWRDDGIDNDGDGIIDEYGEDGTYAYTLFRYFMLEKLSPAIDKGDSNRVDLDGTPVDIGALYYNQSNPGCMDPLSYNYLPTATLDNNTCDYYINSNGDIIFLNNKEYADGIDNDGDWAVWATVFGWGNDDKDGDANPADPGEWGFVVIDYEDDSGNIIDTAYFHPWEVLQNQDGFPIYQYSGIGGYINQRNGLGYITVGVDEWHEMNGSPPINPVINVNVEMGEFLENGWQINLSWDEPVYSQTGFYSEDGSTYYTTSSNPANDEPIETLTYNVYLFDKTISEGINELAYTDHNLVDNQYLCYEVHSKEVVENYENIINVNVRNQVCLITPSVEDPSSEDPLSNKDILLPSTFQLSNAYPNPFNPIASINYSLPQNAVVKLNVYDIQGRFIQTVINDFKVSGYYTAKWNASSYSSGVYLIRMDSGDFTQTQKVVLVK